MIFQRKTKVFCIGSNKTGTTSIARAVEHLGYRVGHQPTAEGFLENWARRDFDPIIRYCRSADAFQDIPFSLPWTYTALDQAFPRSKFVLTIRETPDEWYDSLTQFHTRFVGAGRLPTADDLKNLSYRWKGWLWRYHELVYEVDETSLYNPDIYKNQYKNHIHQAVRYFRHRPNDLLILDVSQENAMESLCHFLEIPFRGQTMPHLNQTRFRTKPKAPVQDAKEPSEKGAAEPVLSAD